ncbi:MAG: GNAT family acetyltransferase [Caulobacteraceae bacterium]
MSLTFTDIAEAEIEDVVALWERCGLTRPWNDPRADIALARREPTSTVIVGREGSGPIQAAAMLGHDGHRGWCYYVAVEPGLQARGLGRAVMAEIETRLKAAGVPKLQLMVRKGNAAVIGFYERLGFLEEDTVVMGKRFDGKTWSTALKP